MWGDALPVQKCKLANASYLVLSSTSKGFVRPCRAVSTPTNDAFGKEPEDSAMNRRARGHRRRCRAPLCAASSHPRTAYPCLRYWPHAARSDP